MTTQLDLEIECVRREIKQRNHVYPRQVENGRLTQKKADYELAMMAAVLARLERLKQSERLAL